MGIFSDWQPEYAARAVPSFPVTAGKQPAVKGYNRLGLTGSGRLVGKFTDAEALGIPLARSRITVLDVDTPDERVLADAMARCGPSPFIVRSGSGNWQAWYRNNGESRRIRPDPAMPVDILGAGFVVAPPSQGSKGAYAIIQGCLDDLPSLPVMQGEGCARSRTYNCTPSPPPLGVLEAVVPGARNVTLWRFLMTQAPHCDDADALIDVARGAASALSSPLPEEEVVKTALSAWTYEAKGSNWIARGNRPPPPSEPDGLLWVHPDAFMLWKILQHHNGGRARFIIANEMAKSMKPKAWKRERLAAARKVLLEHGHITELRKAWTGFAAQYAWGRQ